ncbi:MAG TPA: hypothetical protein VL380_05805 [Nitrosospira sp.]|nr:hypothetical protein [Nitrosospira sp.]
MSLKEPLNKSPLARRRLCGMGCAKGDDANATAKGGAVASEGRCDPVAGCAARSSISAVVASPTLPDPCFPRPLGQRSGAAPLRQEPAKADRLQSPVPSGCGKIGRSWRCAPWHRSPSYDQRRAPYDHPDFNSNALSEDLFRVP